MGNAYGVLTRWLTEIYFTLNWRYNKGATLLRQRIDVFAAFTLYH
ncbi:hypothetical protein EC2872800_0433 [Escherichia coli 2872800]|nr:hypothetical protein ECBCE034MS14_0459 [Escherichia coli BCE034_MS-14]EMV43119.1 hypothetical protein EC2875000_0431 [Escherichia coli 2875000]EMV49261.1 hypothetical protein EC2872800_0433 [Escherichia coli 2872800]EMV63390.1 hypothetical protein EC2867750_0429 [Escherichia coli 2867750]EMV78797.1 hypothetical protein EC2866550_0430 [Escherichia coli 2866550]EMV79159.1 hypothetical protein EC2866450_0454 [Escherichia coli 2866450]EMV80632.1 hypothetical protein EC2866750_0439 [Escherichia